MLQRRVIGMKGQRDEGLEAAGFVLQRAQLEQVVDAVFVVFDVAVEHGRVRFQSDLVGESGGVEPLIAVDLVVADDVAHAVGEYFCAAAGERIHARGFELLQRLANRELGTFRKIRNLDHGEGLEMHLRKALLQAGAEIEEILKRQVGMQSADDVKFGDGLAVSGSGGFESFIERHGVGAGSVLLAAEGAQAAGRDANVGGIDVSVDVEIRLVAVHALANVIGHPAHGENIAGAVESEGIGGVEPLTGQHFGVNGQQARVVGLERVKGQHRFDDIAVTRVKSQGLRDRVARPVQFCFP